jgi:hypothetical protein
VRIDGSRALQYEALVPDYLHFVCQHRGRRTTHQLENALRHLFERLATEGITELHQLTPAVLRTYVGSLHRFRRTTIAVHASALRGWLGYLRLHGLVETTLRKRWCFRDSPPSTRPQRCGTSPPWSGCSRLSIARHQVLREVLIEESRVLTAPIIRCEIRGRLHRAGQESPAEWAVSHKCDSKLSTER